MARSLVFDVAGTGVAAAFLFFFSCLGVGGIAMLGTFAYHPVGAPALRLARTLSLCGAASALVGAGAAIAYFWLAGDVSGAGCAATEGALGGIGAAFAVYARAMLARAAAETARR